MTSKHILMCAHAYLVLPVRFVSSYEKLVEPSRFRHYSGKEQKYQSCDPCRQISCSISHCNPISHFGNFLQLHLRLLYTQPSVISTWRH